MIFTKPARPGLVKTRLMSELTPEEAAKLHMAFLQDLLDRSAEADFERRLAWAVGPQEPLPASRIAAFRQEGADLGQRLFNGLNWALRRFDLVAAVGSDHPELPLAFVEEAFERLASSCDVVLGPASDGGYYLIGVRRSSLHRDLFSEIDWSTSRVRQQTLQRCRDLELRVEELASLEDVDTPDDLRRLAMRLAVGDVPAIPNTRRLLSEWGMIPLPERGERCES